MDETALGRPAILRVWFTKPLQSLFYMRWRRLVKISVLCRAQGLCGRPEVPALRVYASDQAHSSVEKAVITLGLGERNMRRVSSDATYRMSISALRSAIEEDVRDGLLPMAVVATVGTTSTTSVDPVEETPRCVTSIGYGCCRCRYGGAVA